MHLPNWQQGQKCLFLLLCGKLLFFDSRSGSLLATGDEKTTEETSAKDEDTSDKLNKKKKNLDDSSEDSDSVGDEDDLKPKSNTS